MEIELPDGVRECFQQRRADQTSLGIHAGKGQLAGGDGEGNYEIFGEA
jgi:hypothetical protein